MGVSVAALPLIRRRAADSLAAALLVAFVAGLYLPRQAATVLIDHDDVISVIAATCNQLRYAGAEQYGHWVAAADWQQYWHMRSFGCFSAIADGLVQTDIHPPLYFWLLHIWLHLFGVSIFAGLSLNLVFVSVTAVVIYATSRVLGVGQRPAFVVTLAWIVSLSTRTSIGVIRQYSLFTMVAAVLLLVTVLWLRHQHRAYLMAMAAVILAGLLTHYQFVFPMAAILGAAALVLWRRQENGAITHLAGAALIGGLLFVAVHPHFRQSVQLAHAQAQPFDLRVLPVRIGGSALNLVQMFNPLDWAHPLPYGLLDWNRPDLIAISAVNVVLSVATFCFVVAVLRRYLRQWRAADAIRPTERDVPILAGIGTVAIVIGLYVAFVSPVHAIGLQYLNFATPMVFVGIACAWPTRGAVAARRATTSAAAILTTCAVIATTLFVVHRSEVLPIRTVDHADALLLDSYRRGILPTVLWYARPSTQVYAATQQDLLQNFPVLPSRSRGELMYVNSDAFGNSGRNRAAILNKLHQQGYAGGSKLPTGPVPLLPFGGTVYVFAPTG